MRKFYSQNGEDYLVWSLFKHSKNKGYFVEVGALDGIRFSNTYLFELEGWSGLCIEPQPEYFNLLSINRTKSICVNAAAGSQNGLIEFYADPRGEFSTIVQQSAEKSISSKKMTCFEKITIPIYRLDEILVSANSPKNIDIISIDVEGAELDILKGFDLSTFKPRILIIEANNSSSNQLIDNYMKEAHYIKAGRLNENNIYCRSLLDSIRLSIINISCNLTIAPHPLYPIEGVDDQWKIHKIKNGSLLGKKSRQYFTYYKNKVRIKLQTSFRNRR